MITRKEYFTDPRTGEEKPHTQEDEMRFADLIWRRNGLRAEYYAETGEALLDVDPDTRCEISGKKNGAGDGGFRIKGNSTSAEGVVSSHEDGSGIDDSDQKNKFDDWLSTYDREDGRFNAKLEKWGLFREHPDATPTWCHLTTRSPKSGKRTFRP